MKIVILVLCTVLGATVTSAQLICGCPPSDEPPICGSDGRTYYSQCDFNCGGPIPGKYILHYGPCSSPIPYPLPPVPTPYPLPYNPQPPVPIPYPLPYDLQPPAPIPYPLPYNPQPPAPIPYPIVYKPNTAPLLSTRY